MSLPNEEARREILKLALGTVPYAQDVQVGELVKVMEGYSGAEITSIIRESKQFAMREDPVHVKQVEKKHIMQACNTVKRGITPDMLQFYKTFQQTSGIVSLNEVPSIL